MVKERILLLFVFLISVQIAFAQYDSSQTNKDAIYNRPFVLKGETGKVTTAIGGYVEGNTNYFATDGVSDGFSMEFRRFNMFLYSSIAQRIRFLSELEFEHGTEEIRLETALVDFELNPGLIFRMGIILPPVGMFNQNHDSPKWDFIDRPLVSTTLIPSTLSEVGFGTHGRFAGEKYIATYEVYLVNGLGNNIVGNNLNRTSLQAGKHLELFAEDNNGSPSYTGRVALKRRYLGEIGFSYYGGVYNTFRADGLILAPKRRIDLLAFDLNFSIKRLQITGETALLNTDVPRGAGEQFGTTQWGFFTDFVFATVKKPMFRWEKAVFNTCLRLERVDYNKGRFDETGTNIHDDIFAIVPGISFRPAAGTVLRANYRYHWQRDLLGNPVSRTAGIQVGFATYF